MTPTCTYTFLGQFVVPYEYAEDVPSFLQHSSFLLFGQQYCAEAAIVNEIEFEHTSNYACRSVIGLFFFVQEPYEYFEGTI